MERTIFLMHFNRTGYSVPFLALSDIRWFQCRCKRQESIKKVCIWGFFFLTRERSALETEKLGGVCFHSISSVETVHVSCQFCIKWRVILHASFPFSWKKFLILSNITIHQCLVINLVGGEGYCLLVIFLRLTFWKQ